MSSGPEVHFRRATLADYQVAVNIRQNVYSGFDYLATWYREKMHNKHDHVYVAEVDGKVVALDVISVSNGGRTMSGQAARCHPDYTHQGIMTALAAYARDDVIARYPNISVSLATAMMSPFWEKVRQQPEAGRTLEQQWKLYMHITDAESLADGLTGLRRLTSPGKHVARRLNIADAVTILTDADTRRTIFTEPYISAFHNWAPCDVTDENLRQIAQTHDVIATQHPVSHHVETLSYMYLYSLGASVRFDMHIFGRNTPYVYGHLAGHIEHVVSMLKTDQPTCFMMHIYGEDLDFDRIKKDMMKAIGSTKVPIPFYSDDRANFIKRSYKPKANL